MQDDPSDPSEPSAASAAPTEPAIADWAGASGVSGEHVIAGERAPRLHWALMILGPIGLAIAIVLSLWSSSRQIERSVNIQVDETWTPGEQLAVRTQIVGGDLQPLEAKTRVSLALVDGGGRTHELTELVDVAPGLAQGSFGVPKLEPDELARGAELVVHFEPAQLEPFDERLPITLVPERKPGVGHQVISKHMLQWADDTDEQPAEVRIDLRPAGRLLAGFDNELFVRVTDPAGKPWKPKPEGTPATIQVLLISGEFGGKIGKLDDSPVVYEGPVDALGLARFFGKLTSDVVRFEVRLIGEQDIAALAPEPGTQPAQAPDAQPAAPDEPRDFSGPKRRLRFVSHAGTVRIHASTNLAHPGDPVTVAVEAISARKPVFVDVHGPTGAWLDSFTPPLVVPQEREWTIPAGIPATAKAGIVQFEAYQSTLRPEDSSALARVQLVPTTVTPAASIAALVERQREQLSLPRVDKQFEIGRERAYLTEVEKAAATLDEAGVERTRAFLLGSLEAVVHGPPQALNTRAREDETLAAFKRRWTLGIRWFLLGGGVLFIVVMSTMVWRNQRRVETQTSKALGLVAGSPDAPRIDDEALADQSLAIMRSRREVLARGLFTIALMIAALLLTIAMLESLVWEY